jgi:hypothetical protein
MIIRKILMSSSIFTRPLKKSFLPRKKPQRTLNTQKRNNSLNSESSVPSVVNSDFVPLVSHLSNSFSCFRVLFVLFVGALVYSYFGHLADCLILFVVFILSCFRSIPCFSLRRSVDTSCSDRLCELRVFVVFRTLFFFALDFISYSVYLIDV